MDVFGYQLKVWQILCVVGLSVYAAGPMALLAFGGLFYMNRQRQPQIGAQAAPAPNASASASGHRPTSYRGNGTARCFSRPIFAFCDNWNGS